MMELELTGAKNFHSIDEIWAGPPFFFLLKIGLAFLDDGTVVSRRFWVRRAVDVPIGEATGCLVAE